MNHCVAIYSKNKVTDGITPSLINLYRVLNFTALTMLRRVTKTSAQLTTAFMKTKYKENIYSLIPCSASKNYAPPTRSCIEKTAVITRNNKSVSTLIAKIVHLWGTIRGEQPQVHAILGATLLTHTAWNGMGIIHTLFELCNYYSISWKSIMKETLVSTTALSWKVIFDFCYTHQRKTGESKTVPWARVIDDSFFMDLTISRHITLASLLIVPMENAQGGAGIMESKWAMDHASTIEHYHSASLWLHSRLDGTATRATAGTEAACTIAKLMNRPSTSAEQRQYQKKENTTNPEEDLDLGEFNL